MAKKTVVNISNHALILSGGRALAPGEQADGINTDEAHEEGLIAGNALLVLEQKTRKRPTSAAEADTSDEENN